MDITIRSFAMIREAMGSSRVLVSIKDGSTILRAIEKLIEIHPLVEFHILSDSQPLPSLLFAVNKTEIPSGEFSSFVLSNGDELAILPPAGGG